jgi:hypothetical protein
MLRVPFNYNAEIQCAIGIVGVSALEAARSALISVEQI